MVDESNLFNEIGRVRVYLYSLIPVLRHNPNLIRNIITSNF
jgi:hypothetical protein